VVVAGPPDSLGCNPLYATRIVKTQTRVAVAADDDFRQQLLAVCIGPPWQSGQCNKNNNNETHYVHKLG
jgi:hypothetical protein